MPTVNCPKCGAGYDVPAAKLGTAGRKLKCAKCGEIWLATMPALVDTQPVETPAVMSNVDAPSPRAIAELPVQESSKPEVNLPDGLDDLAQLENWGGWGKLWRGENRWLTAAATLGVVGLAVGAWLGWQQWASGPGPEVATALPVQHDAVMVKPPAGVLLNNVEAEVVQATSKDGQVAGMTLKVRGEVHNTGEALVELPQLALELVGLDGAMLDRVRVRELPELLGAGDERTWTVSVTAPTLTEVPAWRVVWLGASSATTVTAQREPAVH